MLQSRGRLGMPGTKSWNAWDRVMACLCTIGKPLVCLNLNCKVTEKEKQVNHWEDSLLLDAPPGQKKEELLKNFEHLKGATNTVTLTTPFQPSQSMDVSGPQNLGAAAFLDFTSRDHSAYVLQH